MRNKMNRCCCNVASVISIQQITGADWSNLEMGLSSGVFIAPFFPGDVSFGFSRIDPISVLRSSTAPVAYPSIGQIPQGIATAYLNFTGYATGEAEPDQTIHIYAARDGGSGVYAVDGLEGPIVWQQSSGESWGLDPGRELTTPNIASILNAVTSTAFNMATNRVLIILRSAVEESLNDDGRYVKVQTPTFTLAIT